MAARRSRSAGAGEHLVSIPREQLPTTGDAPTPTPAVRHYRLLFDRAPLPYVVTDFTGNIQAANRAAAVLLKRPSEMLVGRALGAFVPLECRAEFRDVLARLPLLDGLKDWRLTLLPYHGEPVAVAMHASVLDGAWEGRDAIFWIVRPRRKSGS